MSIDAACRIAHQSRISSSRGIHNYSSPRLALPCLDDANSNPGNRLDRFEYAENRLPTVKAIDVPQRWTRRETGFQGGWKLIELWWVVREGRQATTGPRKPGTCRIDCRAANIEPQAQMLMAGRKLRQLRCIAATWLSLHPCSRTGILLLRSRSVHSTWPHFDMALGSLTPSSSRPPPQCC